MQDRVQRAPLPEARHRQHLAKLVLGVPGAVRICLIFSWFSNKTT